MNQTEKRLLLTIILFIAQFFLGYLVGYNTALHHQHQNQQTQTQKGEHNP